MSYRFFQNRSCEFFPCHAVTDKPEKCFNCLFCFCPLYGNWHCGGNFQVLQNGTKDCSNCLIPHYHYNYIIQKLTQNQEAASLNIQIKYHSNTLTKIEKIEQGDWIDLRAAETISLHAGEFRLISLGVSMKLPKGYEAHIAPRSSTFKKWGILQVNSVGVVDESYCGDQDIWRMPVYATRDTTIEENDRICQFRIVEKMPAVEFVEVDKLSDQNRGGFGSTGQK